MGLTVPAKPPWVSRTLPRAQDPEIPQPCLAMGPPSRAHPRARLSACPRPVPIPREGPDAPGWGCHGHPGSLLLPGGGTGPGCQAHLCRHGEPPPPPAPGSCWPMQPPDMCGLFREKWDLPYPKTRLNFITSPINPRVYGVLGRFLCFTAMGTVILQQIIEILQGLGLLCIWMLLTEQGNNVSK